MKSVTLPPKLIYDIIYLYDFYVAVILFSKFPDFSIIYYDIDFNILTEIVKSESNQSYFDAKPILPYLLLSNIVEYANVKFHKYF